MFLSPFKVKIFLENLLNIFSKFLSGPCPSLNFFKYGNNYPEPIPIPCPHFALTFLHQFFICKSAKKFCFPS